MDEELPATWKQLPSVPMPLKGQFRWTPDADTAGMAPYIPTPSPPQLQAEVQRLRAALRSVDAWITGKGGSDADSWCRWARALIAEALGPHE